MWQRQSSWAHHSLLCPQAESPESQNGLLEFTSTQWQDYLRTSTICKIPPQQCQTAQNVCECHLLCTPKENIICWVWIRNKVFILEKPENYSYLCGQFSNIYFALPHFHCCPLDLYLWNTISNAAHMQHLASIHPPTLTLRCNREGRLLLAWFKLFKRHAMIFILRKQSYLFTVAHRSAPFEGLVRLSKSPSKTRHLHMDFWLFPQLC